MIPSVSPAPAAAAAPALLRRLAMTMAATAAADPDGGCARERLLDAGFTPAELAAHGEAARALAARLSASGRPLRLAAPPPRRPAAPPPRHPLLAEIDAIEAAHDGRLPPAAQRQIRALWQRFARATEARS